MSAIPPAPQSPGGVAPAQPPAPKSSGNKLIFWIIGIVGGLFLLIVICVMGIGFYAVHKVKQAGFDTELMKKNPALASAKLAVSLNPDVEIVSSDDNTGSIVVRDKKTGKVVTMKFDSEKKSMVLIDENGKTTSMTTTGEGQNGGIEVKSSEGTMKMGATADKAPGWVPNYPGSSPQSTFSTANDSEQSGSFTFTTTDPADKVISFYSGALKSAGFSVSNMTGNSEGNAGGMVSSEDKVNKRTVVVVIGTESNGTQVNVTFTQKK